MSGASAFAGTKPVEPRHRLDEERLDAWLSDHVEDYAGPLSVSQFKGGQSNPTYRLETPDRAYVLRRKPFGPLLPSAHAVEREFQLISALHGKGFPVPRAYALCEDPDVVGSVYYVMEAVEGAVHWNAALPEMAPPERRRVYEAMIATLARLHGTDYAAAGLADYGRPGNYFVRQVDRWTRQYRAAEDQRIEAAERLIAWLPGSVPEQARTAIVHGDYRLDNMIFSGGSVAAVLDWELSTLGDPLADFSYLLMHWVLPADGRSALGGLDLPALGIPTRDEVVTLYCRATGRESLPALDWYFAYNLFRLVGILQGIAGRMKAGTAASEHAAEMAARVPRLAEAAWSFAERAAPEMQLDGAIVVVTGAARGIGRALCERVHAEGAGVVVALDIDGDGAAETARRVGGQSFALDVADADAVARTIARIETEFGPIRLYCSNAGILERDPDFDLATSATDASWARSWAVNVMGHVYAARALLPGWIARREGTFLATVSAAGLLSQIGSATYSTTKHAALGFCEHLAIAHRDHGIRVGALCPQGVDTDMVRGASGREPALLDGLLSPDAVAEAALRGLAEGRFLILPHPQVAGYQRNKAADTDRWIAGMAKLRRAQRAALPRRS